MLFLTQHLSAVAGLRLVDGREVVVKARPPAARLAACAAVQRHLWAAGFACPELLAGPAPLGALEATAEALAPGGDPLPRDADAPRLAAEALADLVGRAPDPAAVAALGPPPAWVWWDYNRPGLWPPPDDLDADLNATPGPAWLDDLARRARRIMAACRLPPVIGHADWETQNLRWRGGRLHVAHDWDSLTCQPEALIAGFAAAVFPAHAPLTDATVDESAAFLAAYAAARGRPWSDTERRAAWAAGLWVRAFNARKAAARTPPRPAVLAQLEAEAAERLRRAEV